MSARYPYAERSLSSFARRKASAARSTAYARALHSARIVDAANVPMQHERFIAARTFLQAVQRFAPGISPL